MRISLVGTLIGLTVFAPPARAQSNDADARAVIAKFKEKKPELAPLA